MRRMPIVLLAIAGMAVLLWLIGQTSGMTGAQRHDAVPMPAAANSRTAPESVPAGLDGAAREQHDGSHTAEASLHQEAQPSTAPTPMETDIPPYESLPADVIVEIGPPIDADNPPQAPPATPQQVITLGPVLDADGPITTPENSSTEIVSIGDPMPVDDEPR